MLDTRLSSLNMHLPDSAELTLDVDIGQKPSVVRYYYMDHAQKNEFWGEKMSTETLTCPPVIDYNHLSTLIYPSVF